LFLVDQGLQELGHGQRLQFHVGQHMDGAVGADGHRGAQGFLALLHAAGHGDDLGGHALFLQPHRFLDGDLVERVHAHLHVGDVHATAVGPDADLHIRIGDSLGGDEDLGHANAWHLLNNCLSTDIYYLLSSEKNAINFCDLGSPRFQCNK
jgi:hypothetical protein